MITSVLPMTSRQDGSINLWVKDPVKERGAQGRGGEG
jgi:hypothetical protein